MDNKKPKYKYGDLVFVITVKEGKAVSDCCEYMVVYSHCEESGGFAYSVTKNCELPIALHMIKNLVYSEEENLVPTTEDICLVLAARNGYLIDPSKREKVSVDSYARPAFNRGDEVLPIVKANGKWYTTRHFMIVDSIEFRDNRRFVYWLRTPSANDGLVHFDSDLKMLELGYPINEMDLFGNIHFAGDECRRRNGIKRADVSDENKSSPDISDSSFRIGDEVYTLYKKGGKWEYSRRVFTIKEASKMPDGVWVYTLVREGRGPNLLTKYKEGDMCYYEEAAALECDERNACSEDAAGGPSASYEYFYGEDCGEGDSCDDNDCDKHLYAEEDEECEDEEYEDEEYEDDCPIHIGDKVYTIYSEGGEWKYSKRRFFVTNMNSENGSTTCVLARAGNAPNLLPAYHVENAFLDIEDAMAACKERNHLTRIKNTSKDAMAFLVGIFFPGLDEEILGYTPWDDIAKRMRELNKQALIELRDTCITLSRDACQMAESISRQPDEGDK